MTAPLYRVWCRFEPDHLNLPAGRRGQWRVSVCNPVRAPMITPLVRNFGSGEIAIFSTKPYPRGSIIRPHKELNRVLAARKAAA